MADEGATREPEATSPGPGADEPGNEPQPVTAAHGAGEGGPLAESIPEPTAQPAVERPPEVTGPSAVQEATEVTAQPAAENPEKKPQKGK